MQIDQEDGANSQINEIAPLAPEEPQNNKSEMDWLWGESFPEPEVFADVLSPAELSFYIAVAKNSELGEQYILGGRLFDLHFPSIKCEEGNASLLRQEPLPLIHIMYNILREQFPTISHDWLNEIDESALYGMLEHYKALDVVVHKMSAILEGRRAEWRSLAKPTKYASRAVEIPADTAGSTMLEWCARTYGHHISEVRAKYSSALLILLFDAWWWQTCAAPIDLSP
jgi:hypothetical protein